MWPVFGLCFDVLLIHSTAVQVVLSIFVTKRKKNQDKM